MTDLTCEFFQRINQDASACQDCERKHPHKAEIRQLYAVVQSLDKATPHATRKTNGVLTGWINGLCGTCARDQVTQNSAAVNTRRLKEGVGTLGTRWNHRNKPFTLEPLIKHGMKNAEQFVEELKAVLELIHKAVLETTERLTRQTILKNKCKEAQAKSSWNWLSFIRPEHEEVSAHDQNRHINAMTEILEMFLRDLKDLIKLYEISLLKAEVTEQEILSNWCNYKASLKARKDDETEAAAHYAAAVKLLTRRLESYLTSSLIIPGVSSKDDDQSSVLATFSFGSNSMDTNRRTHSPLNLAAEDSDEGPALYQPLNGDLKPEEVEVVAQTNPKIQELQCLQERDNLEEESVMEITRKVERISDLLNVLTIEIENQHSMSSNITNAAIANVSSAQSELEKAMQRKIRKVFRPRSANQKWLESNTEQTSRAPIASLNDEFDDGSTVGSVDSIICPPAVPPDMTEPSKAAGGSVNSPPSRNSKRAVRHPESDYSHGTSDSQKKLPAKSAMGSRSLRSGTISTGERKQIMQLSDFTLIKTIGTGSFGRVFLAKPAKSALASDEPISESVCRRKEIDAADSMSVSNKYEYSLANKASDASHQVCIPNYVAVKRLSKCTVLDMKQVHHVRSEKEILEMVDHPFLVRILGKFQDQFYLYIVMEFVGGGEFFSFLRKSKRLTDEHSKFYAAHIVLIFEYLHDRCVVYRDLKPENLLITQLGYLKLTDFGFAKYLVNRTYTLCGTPEYIAPEVLLNKGHGFPVDWWALGVLIYEMIVGYPPFFDEDALCIYQKILRGKIVFPRFFPKDAKSLVKHLLCHDLVRRIGHVRDGVSDVRNHRWFHDLSYNDLYRQALTPPHIPRQTNNAFKYFGEYPEDETQAPAPAYDPFADW